MLLHIILLNYNTFDIVIRDITTNVLFITVFDDVALIAIYVQLDDCISAAIEEYVRNLMQWIYYLSRSQFYSRRVKLNSTEIAFFIFPSLLFYFTHYITHYEYVR